jgi:probable FeS assembly SUF system protein SufT
MPSDQSVTLSRDCEAILVPSGEKLRLRRGSRVWVTQSLGGTYTVMTNRGDMARIAGEDSDALGMESGVRKASLGTEQTDDIEKLVWDQLKTCFDPEIPVNIVDLGLIYDCRVTPLAEGGNRAEIQFTLTAQGCGMGEVLKKDIQARILSVPGIKEVDVELVWDPPWDQSKMSKEAKIELGIL